MLILFPTMLVNAPSMFKKLSLLLKSHLNRDKQMKRVSLSVEYNILSLNFHCFFGLLYCRDVDLTEKLDYSSAVILLGYSLILAILRSFNVRDEATRVMVSAPLSAFAITHVMYINFYKLDYGMSCPIISLYCHWRG